MSAMIGIAAQRGTAATPGVRTTLHSRLDFARSVMGAEYSQALQVFKDSHPVSKWALTQELTAGLPWYFPKHNAYARIARLDSGALEITGAFKLSDVPHFVESIVDLCRTMGGQTVQIDCFAPVTTAWARAGFNTYAMDPFNIELAPEGWPIHMLGTPNVMYMRKHIGG